MLPFLRAGLLALELTFALVVLPSHAGDAEDDPNLWLEPFDTPAVMQWVQSENAKTLAVLGKDDRFARFQEEALGIAQAKDRIPMPVSLAGAVFNFWQDPDHIRGIWRRTSAASYAEQDPHWETVLDLDGLSAREHANWVWKGANCEETREVRCMLELSDGGEDAVTVREFDLKAKDFVRKGFQLPHGKQRLAWEDPNTLLVARAFAPDQLTTSGYPFVVKRLARGDTVENAREVFRGSATDGGYGVEPIALHDGSGHRAVLILRPRSTFEFEYYLLVHGEPRRLALPPKVSIETLVSGQLIINLKQDWKVAGHQFIAGSLLALDLAQTSLAPGQLDPVVVFAPGPRAAVESVAATRDALLVALLENVRGRVLQFRRQADKNWTSKALALPENATLEIADADRHSTHFFIRAEGFLQPPSLWAGETGHGTLAQIKVLAAKFDSAGKTIDQFEARSSDGTLIPYFVVHPSAMALDASHPTVLYAYGGFEVSETPRYLATVGKLWLEQGGVFVLANIRGGGEFGPAWHEAGLKTHRQIIYDDFAAVGRDLIARQITSPRRLGIQGGSNGGLLMGVEFTQHPELWHAVDIQVPLLDMLRFEQIAAGPSWVGEYGSVSVPEDRAFLASISPYANLRRGVEYPEPLVWTTTKDDRVGPQHARKFAARLGQLGLPYLFYEVTEGGHGAGANLQETARTNALEWTYFTRKLVD